MLIFADLIRVMAITDKNYKNMKLNRLIFIFISLACMALAACSDDEPKIPDNAITLNMMNSDNGKTFIGGSDVYINSANNFVSSKCGIVDLGKKGSFSQNPDLTQIAYEMAVTPGNFYQIVLANDVRDIAGERAVSINADYYNLYVDSWLYDSDKEISGAKVRYAECSPKTDKLPAWDNSYPIFLKSWDDNNYAEAATYNFEKGVVIDSDYSVYNVEGYDLANSLQVKITDNKIEFSNKSYTPSGKAKVVMYVRYGRLYTRVQFLVSSSI